MRRKSETAVVEPGTTSGPPWLRGGRMPSLDGLRAIAVLLVLLAHARETRGFPDVAFLHAIGRKGGIGVEVFFVISGYLITVLMLRERDRTRGLAIGPFYLRRVLRIVPAYVCLLLAVAALQTAGLARLSGRDWLGATTYTVNFLYHPAWEIGHAWSLSIEEHFYLLWPLVMSLAPRRAGAVALGALVFCFAARWVVMLAAPSYTPMAELWTFTRADVIATGCLLAVLAWDDAWRARLDRLAGDNRVLAAAAAVLGLSLVLTGRSAKYSVGIAYTVNALCLALLAWAAMTRHESRVGRFLNGRALATIGVASYSIYLWQQLFLNGRNTGPLCAFPQNVVLALVTAFASYRWVERPFLQLKDRFSLEPGRRADSAPKPGDPESMGAWLCATLPDGR